MSRASPPPKDFDVVVFGATGFTGGLIARYLLQDPETATSTGFTWALAGRNAAKLEQVKQRLKTVLPDVDPATIDAVPVVVADSSNQQALEAMVRRTRVVLTVVGPYKLYGEPLVRACAENGVHYCDLTGESMWIREMIDKYQSVAEKTGAVLVNCCGFDCVPSDLSVFVLNEWMRKHKQSTASKITLAFTTFVGGVSGGTLASVFSMLDTAPLWEVAKMRNPFFLTDAETVAEKKQVGVYGPNDSSLLLRREPDLSLWTSFFVGGIVNQSIVHRSNYLLKNAYGDKFIYRERSAIGGFFLQLLATIGIAIGSLFIFFPPTRALIRRLVPQSGEGPSEEVMKNGKFIAQSVAYDATGKVAAKATTVGSEDPGYAMTSKVIAECAVALAKGDFANAGLPGGFHTSASAFGDKLVVRLRDKKIMKIDVHAA